MNKFFDIYQQVYKEGQLFGLDKKKRSNFFQKSGRRPNSVAIIGGVLGDEGKGRATDELTSMLLKDHNKLVHYRDNGGANAGHTVRFKDIKIELHQVGASALQKRTTVVMGKEMVIHPEDLLAEIEMIKQALSVKQLPANLIIDEMAFLCLDTHRAFETVLKMKSTGSKGSTGRGIAPAYADVIYRHPLRIRDLISRDWQERLRKHYQLYQQLIKGFGYELKEISVSRLGKADIKVGRFAEMSSRIAQIRGVLKQYAQPVNEFLRKTWESEVPLVIEKAQGVGLDKRWGVYPDVTASNCCFDGIYSSSEGIIDHDLLSIKAAAMKATYSSSVGARRLPTLMKEQLAHRIREDADEYAGSKSKPHDIAYIDLPMLSFLFKVSQAEQLIMTHLDICYPEVPIKVCVAYKIGGKEVGYRPDQLYLNKVKPVYLEVPAWDGQAVQSAQTVKELPLEARQYLAFISQALGVEPFIVTTGPAREQTIVC